MNGFALQIRKRRRHAPQRTNSRGLKLLGLAAGFAATALLANPASGQILQSKRGFAGGISYSQFQTTGAAWYYDWGSSPSATIGNYNADFYPMFWNAASQTKIDSTLATNPKYILGYNEPDGATQANMTVAQAITNWTLVSNSTNAYNAAHSTNIKLVSPAVTTLSSGWLQDFMSQAQAASLKVDAIAIHWYGAGSTDGAADASSFESAVNQYHNLYNLPVIITEFAAHDWSNTNSTASMTAANTKMLSIVIPWMNSQSWITGYAPYQWFANNETALYTGNPPLPTTLGLQYNGAVASGSTADISGQNLGEHVAMLNGGTLTMTSSAGTIQYINALSGTSAITGSINWGLNAASSANWVQIQPGATLVKTGTNTITFQNGTVTNSGVLQVSGGTLQCSAPISGSGSLNITGTGTAILSGTNTYTGGTNIFSGTVQVASDATLANTGGSNGANVAVYPAGTFAGAFPIDQAFLGQVANPTTTYGVIALAANDSNSLDFNSANLSKASLGGVGTQTYSGTLTPSGNTYRLGGGGGTLVFSGPLSGATSTLQINPNVASNTTVSLTSTGNTLGGTVVINSGTLQLDYTGTATAVAPILSGNALSMAGGTLKLLGTNATSNTTTQSFSSLALTTDGNAVVNTVGAAGLSSTLNLNAITRSAGATVDFTLPTTGSITTTTANSNGILGGYATVGGNTWAVSAGTGTVAGAITGLPTASYTTTATAGATVASYTNANIDVTTSQQISSGAITPNSLRFNTAAARTLTLTGTNVIGSGGILVTSAVGNNLTTITGGTLTSGNAQGDIIITNNDAANQLTIASIVSAKVTASGPGTVVLTGALSGGPYYSNGGTLNLSAGTLGNTTVVANSGGTIILGALTNSVNCNLTVNSGGTIVDNNTTFSNTLNFNGGTMTGSGYWNQQSQNSGDKWTAGAGTSSVLSQATVYLNTNTPIVLNAGSMLTVTSTLNNAGFNTSGSGTLILAGTSNFTGAISLGGTTIVQAASADTGKAGPLGNSSSGAQILLNGGTLQWSLANNFDYSSRFNTAAGKTYNFDTNQQDVNFATPLTSAGAPLNKLGEGTLTINGANTFSGATSIKAGTLALGATGTLANTAGLSIDSGATFDLSAATTPFALSSGSATLGGSGIVNGNYTHTTGILSPGGTGTVGTLTFNNDLTLAGGTLSLDLSSTSNASGGTVNDLISVGGDLNFTSLTVLNTNSFSGSVPAGTVYNLINFTGNFNGSTLNLVSPSTSLQVVQIDQEVDLIASAPLPLNTGSLAGNFSVNSIYGVSSTSTAGSLSEALTGNVAAGGVEIDTTGLASGANLALGTNTLTLNTGGWIQIAGPNPYSITASTGAITTSAPASNLTFTNFDTSPAGVTISAAIIDNAGTAVTFSGAGNTILRAVNTYTGATTIGSAANLQIAGSGVLGSGNYAALITNNGTLRYSSSANQTLSGVISGSGALIKDTSPSTLTLASASGMTGPVTVSAGTLVTGAGNTIGSGSVYIGNGATLIFSGTANNFNGGETWNVSGTVTNTGSAYVYLANTTNLIGGTISGSGTSSGGSFIANTGSTVVTAIGTGNLISANSIGTNQQITFNTPSLTDALTIKSQIGSSGFNNNGNGVFKTGLGTVTVTGSCVYQKQTTISAGTFQIGNGSSGSWAATSSITVAAGANLAYDQANNTNNNAKAIIDNGTVTGLEGANITNTLSGVITGTGAFVQAGAGTTILTGTNAYNGGTTVNAGKLVLGSAGAFPSSTSLTIATGATFQIANHGSGSTVVPIVSSLSNTGTVDLVNNAMVIQNASVSIGSIRAQIASGYAQGTWNGSAGAISSSAANADTKRLTAVGFTTGLTSFQSITVSATDVLLKYTYYGDANLSGNVDGSDYSRTDNGFLLHLTGWSNGDFNYDGTINGSDYTLLDNVYNTQGVQLSSQIATPTALLADFSAASSVPEPGSLVVIGIGAMGLLGRRRRTH